MLNEFQVLYRDTAMGELDLTPKPVGPVMTIMVRATNHVQARSTLMDAGVHVVAVGDGRPVIDWDQRTFNREEAGVYLRGSASKVDEAMAKGDLPKARNGRPIFTRDMLDELIRKKMVEQVRPPQVEQERRAA